MEYYCLCVLRWLMRPILALNCLLQIVQERSEEESAIGDALALAFRCARFCLAFLIIFVSYLPAPLLMRPRLFAQSCASCSQRLLKSLRETFRMSFLVLFVRLFDLCLFGFVGFLFLLVSGFGLRFVIEALPGLFSYNCFASTPEESVTSTNFFKSPSSAMRVSLRAVISTLDLSSSLPTRDVLRCGLSEPALSIKVRTFHAPMFKGIIFVFYFLFSRLTSQEF